LVGRRVGGHGYTDLMGTGSVEAETRSIRVPQQRGLHNTARPDVGRYLGVRVGFTWQTIAALSAVRSPLTFDCDL